MPVITAIRASRRQSDRFSIYVDGTFIASLSGEQLSSTGYRIDQDIDDEQIDRIKSLADERKALDLVYRYISYRPRSSGEVRQYLRGKKIDPHVAEHVIQVAHDRELINDSSFAIAWAADRVLSGRSLTQIKIELMQKGISSEAVQEALSGLSTDEVVDSICRLIQRRNLQRRYADEMTLTRYLRTKGFGLDDIKAALQRLGGD